MLQYRENKEGAKTKLKIEQLIEISMTESSFLMRNCIQEPFKQIHNGREHLK